MATTIPVLFKQGDLRLALDELFEKAKAEVEHLPREELASASDAELAARLTSKFRVEPVRLLKDRIRRSEPREVTITHRGDANDPWERSDVRTYSGVEINVYIPFEGEPRVFQLRANLIGGEPCGTIEESCVRLTYRQVDLNQAQLVANYQSDVKRLEAFLEAGSGLITSYNESLQPLLISRINARRQKLSAYQQLAEALAIPLRRDEQAYPIPLRRQPPPVTKPTRIVGKPTPEWFLETEEYDFIISRIRLMSLVMERNPHVFASLEEEDLRTHFLVPLNASYDATGETFNYEGKTDILIRKDGRNVFIAECALWKGESYLSQKIDQLLGYTSWRDTKCAILVFSRNKDFNAVLAKVPNVMASHGNYLRFIGRTGETEFRHVFSQREDRQREIVLSVLVFNVPTPHS